jgi:hypothetical protein
MTIESHDRQHSTFVNHDDLTIDEYIDIIYGLLISTSFHSETILRGFKEFLEERESWLEKRES